MWPGLKEEGNNEVFSCEKWVVCDSLSDQQADTAGFMFLFVCVLCNLLFRNFVVVELLNVSLCTVYDQTNKQKSSL